MRSRSQTKRSGNFLESLEKRLALAGNVAVDDSTGVLVITGDNSANAIIVQQINASTFRVTGGGTRVNGSFSPQQFSNVLFGVRLDMAGGSDAVSLLNSNIPGPLEALMGDGNDALLVSGITTRSQSVIDGGSGNNAITIDKCTFNFGLGLFGGNNADAIALSRSVINGGLLAELGDGTNGLAMLNVKILETESTPAITPFQDEFDIPDCGAIIIGGSGKDAISMNGVQIDCFTQIDTEGGNDGVAIADSRFGGPLDFIPDEPEEIAPEIIDPSLSETAGLYIETGLGSDAVAIATTTVTGALIVDTANQIAPDGLPTPSEPIADGNDSVALNKVTVRTAIVDGEEIPEEVNQFFGTLVVDTGNGADTVAANAVQTDGPAAIVTTDLVDFGDLDSSSNLDKGDAVAIASSSFNKLDFTFARLEPEETDGQEEVIFGLLVVTGNGNDAVAIANTNVKEAAVVFTGNGTDKVAIDRLVADEIYVELGNGNFDALAIANSAADEALFFGGGGTNDILTRVKNKFVLQSPPANTLGNGFEFVIG